MIDRVAARLGRALYEVPVGFKWFVDGLLDGSLGFGGEESAGASFLRRDGTVWTTDKDGIVPALLAAEITARTRPRPGRALPRADAASSASRSSDRIDAPATPEQKKRLRGALAGAGATARELAGEPIEAMLDQRAGQRRADRRHQGRSPSSGWFAARPSGTEDIYKIYAESFRGDDHLQRDPERSAGDRRSRHRLDAGRVEAWATTSTHRP